VHRRNRRREGQNESDEWRAERAEPRTTGSVNSTLHESVDHVLTRRAPDLVDHERTTSQSRAARRGSPTSAQSLPPPRRADVSQARSTNSARGAWSTQITWCRTKAPKQWPGSIPIPSGRTRPARAPWVRHVLAFAYDQAAPALSIIAFLEMLARALLILGAVSCREIVRRSACAPQQVHGFCFAEETMTFPVTENIAKSQRHISFYLACGMPEAPPIIFLHGKYRQRAGS
jgi:hypothetical protein